MLMFRSTHRALMAAKDAEIASLAAMCAEAWNRETEVRRELLALIADARPKPVTVAAKVPDPIAEAIRVKAGSNAPLRTHLAMFARAERAKGTAEEEIVKMLADWTYRPEKAGEPTQADRDAANEMMADVLG
jgi:hypothetical protein